MGDGECMAPCAFLGTNPQLTLNASSPNCFHAGNQDSGRFRAIAGGRFIGSHTIPETVLRFLSRDIASIRCDSLVGGSGH